MADLFAKHLLSSWDQTIKPTSRQVLPVFGAEDVETSSEGWNTLSCMEVLGHYIDNRGSIDDDYSKTQTKMWRAFWANAGSFYAKRIPLRYKLLLLQRTTLSVANQHFARWPFTLERAKKFDRLQRKMLLICAAVRADAGELPDDFWNRRKRVARELQSKCGKWSVRWATQVTNWHAHIDRDPNFSWPSQLRRVRPAEELRQRRWVWQRPRTRAFPGFTCARWSESVLVAREYLQQHR